MTPVTTITWLPAALQRLGIRGVWLVALVALAGCDGALIGGGAQQSQIQLVEATNEAGSSLVTTRDEISAIATFFETAAGGATTLDAANFSNSSDISFNFTYEIA